MDVTEMDLTETLTALQFWDWNMEAQPIPLEEYNPNYNPIIVDNLYLQNMFDSDEEAEEEQQNQKLGNDEKDCKITDGFTASVLHDYLEFKEKHIMMDPKNSTYEFLVSNIENLDMEKIHKFADENFDFINSQIIFDSDGVAQYIGNDNEFIHDFVKYLNYYNDCLYCSDL